MSESVDETMSRQGEIGSMLVQPLQRLQSIALEDCGGSSSVDNLDFECAVVAFVAQALFDGLKASLRPAVEERQQSVGMPPTMIMQPGHNLRIVAPHRICEKRQIALGLSVELF